MKFINYSMAFTVLAVLAMGFEYGRLAAVATGMVCLLLCTIGDSVCYEIRKHHDA